MTPRYRPLQVGVDYMATCDGKPFAVLRILNRWPKAWDVIVHENFKENGYDSTEQMKKYLLNNGQILSSFRDVVWLHEFEVRYVINPS